MIIKCGTFVSHTGAKQWGTGKITEVVSMRATIQFSDGIIRKIASSHYESLKQAEAASYVPPSEPVPVPIQASARKPKKAKP
jgi:hypothetical protein